MMMIDFYQKQNYILSDSTIYIPISLFYDKNGDQWRPYGSVHGVQSKGSLKDWAP